MPPVSPLNTILSLSLLLTFFFFHIFLYVRHEDHAYTHSLPTPLFSYHQTRLSGRDSDGFKHPPRSSRMASPVVVCFLFFLFSLPRCVFDFSPFRHSCLESLSTTCRLSPTSLVPLSIPHSQSLPPSKALLFFVILGRQYILTVPT